MHAKPLKQIGSGNRFKQIESAAPAHSDDALAIFYPAKQR